MRFILACNAFLCYAAQKCVPLSWSCREQLAKLSVSWELAHKSYLDFTSTKIICLEALEDFVGSLKGKRPIPMNWTIVFDLLEWMRLPKSLAWLDPCASNACAQISSSTRKRANKHSPEETQTEIHVAKPLLVESRVARWNEYMISWVTLLTWGCFRHLPEAFGSRVTGFGVLFTRSHSALFYTPQTCSFSLPPFLELPLILVLGNRLSFSPDKWYLILLD